MILQEILINLFILKNVKYKIKEHNVHQYLDEYYYIEYNDKLFESNCPDKWLSVDKVLELKRYKEGDDEKSIFCRVQYYPEFALDNTKSMKPESLLSRKYAYKTFSSMMYKDKLDAKIQVAYIFAKARIKASEVNSISNGFISSSEFLKLYDYFEEEFPEKII